MLPAARITCTRLATPPTETKMSARFRPLTEFHEYPPEQMRERAEEFSLDIQRRRSVRDFAPRPIPPGILRNCIQSAASAPSGANRQPWHFAVVTDPEVRQRIRHAAEAEEAAFYQRRAPEAWLQALEPLGTDQHKPFLEIAPALIAVFYQRYGLDEQGERYKNYYASESVGLASGLLLAALHRAGLATLTHTPSPMNFLRDILDRPKNEAAFLLIVTGYPAENCQVPDIQRKPLDQVMSWHGKEE